MPKPGRKEGDVVESSLSDRIRGTHLAKGNLARRKPEEPLLRPPSSLALHSPTEGYISLTQLEARGQRITTDIISID